MSYFDLLDEAPSTCFKFVHKGGVQMAAQGLKVFLAKVYVSFETCSQFVPYTTRKIRDETQRFLARFKDTYRSIDCPL